METIATYKVGEIRSLMKENTQEFKPKMGAGVETGNKKTNDDAYKSAEKRGKDFDGGLGKTKQPDKKIEKVDDNRTTLDYTFDYEPSKEYKDRIKAQAQGYISKKEKENGIEKSGDFEGNTKLYDAMKDNAELANKAKFISKKAGLRGQNMPDEAFIKDTMYENKKNMKTLNFKRTKFLNEGHMLSLIPEDYKKAGTSFIMKDSESNEYIIECVANEKTNLCEANVVKYQNKVKMNEEFDRIKNLFTYKSSDYFKNSDVSSRLNENRKVGELIDAVRKINTIEEE